eukprot:4226853-Prymnesium_polylepis.1
MGSSQSSSPPPPPPPPVAANTSPALSRTFTEVAHEVLTEGLRNDLKRAKADASRYKRYAEDSMADLDDVVAAMDNQREQFKMYGMVAVAGSALVAGALGVLAGGGMARRQQTAALARLSQEMVDLRRRGAADLAKAERFGCASLAKALIAPLDAMDALCEAGGGDEEGSRLTRSAFHDALRKSGIDRVEPSVGEPFDVATMEVRTAQRVAATARARATRSTHSPRLTLAE